MIAYPLAAHTLDVNSGRLEFLSPKDGVVAPVFVSDTSFLRARVDERSALHSIDLHLPRLPGDHQELLNKLNSSLAIRLIYNISVTFPPDLNPNLHRNLEMVKLHPLV